MCYLTQGTSSQMIRSPMPLRFMRVNQGNDLALRNTWKMSFNLQRIRSEQAVTILQYRLVETKNLKVLFEKIMLDKQSNSQLGQQVAADTSTDTLNLGFATRFPVASSLFQKNQVFGGVNLKYVRTKKSLPL